MLGVYSDVHFALLTNAFPSRKPAKRQFEAERSEQDAVGTGQLMGCIKIKDWQKGDDLK